MENLNSVERFIGLEEKPIEERRPISVLGSFIDLAAMIFHKQNEWGWVQVGSTTEARFQNDVSGRTFTFSIDSVSSLYDGARRQVDNPLNPPEIREHQQAIADEYEKALRAFMARGIVPSSSPDYADGAAMLAQVLSAPRTADTPEDGNRVVFLSSNRPPVKQAVAHGPLVSV